MRLHPQVVDRLDAIERIVIETQEPGVRIIDKTGPLANPADRDHCIQYMVAVPLIYGRLTAADYEDAVAHDPRIDALRASMEVRENPQFTADYYDAGQALHRQRGPGLLHGRHAHGARARRLAHRPPAPAGGRLPGAGREIPRLAAVRSSRRSSARRIEALFADPARLDAMPVDDFVAHLVRN